MRPFSSVNELNSGHGVIVLNFRRTLHLLSGPANHYPFISKFIEEAVRWRVFHRTVQAIKEQNADTDPAELQRIIDAVVREVRAAPLAKRKTNKM